MLRSEMRDNLPDNCGVLIFDFGANIVAGHKRIVSESTQRKLTLVTDFAVTLEYKFPGKLKKLLHTLVFSKQLAHSSFHDVRYITLALQQPLLKGIISRLTTLHCWNDNGKHLNSSEYCTFVLASIPEMFPNILLPTDNRTQRSTEKILLM